jgi:hypothetical protein
MVVLSLSAMTGRTAQADPRRRMRDELLNETLFLSLDHARVAIAAGFGSSDLMRVQNSTRYSQARARSVPVFAEYPLLNGNITRAPIGPQSNM